MVTRVARCILWGALSTLTVFVVTACVTEAPDPTVGDAAERALTVVPADREWKFTAVDLDMAIATTEVDEAPEWFIETLLFTVEQDGIRLEGEGIVTVADVWFGGVLSRQPWDTTAFISPTSSGLKVVEGGFDRAKLKRELLELGFTHAPDHPGDLWECVAPCSTKAVKAVLFLDATTIVFAIGAEGMKGLEGVISGSVSSVLEETPDAFINVWPELPELALILQGRSCNHAGCEASVWYSSADEQTTSWTVIYAFGNEASAAGALGRIEYDGVPWRTRELACESEVKVTQEGRMVTRTTTWQRSDLVGTETEGSQETEPGGLIRTVC